MRPTEFLQGDITERFLVDTEEQSLQQQDRDIVFLTPIWTISLFICPVVTTIYM